MKTTHPSRFFSLSENVVALDLGRRKRNCRPKLHCASGHDYFLQNQAGAFTSVSCSMWGRGDGSRSIGPSLLALSQLTEGYFWIGGHRLSLSWLKDGKVIGVADEHTPEEIHRQESIEITGAGILPGVCEGEEGYAREFE
jgi:hypothetical protein